VREKGQKTGKRKGGHGKGSHFLGNFFGITGEGNQARSKKKKGRHVG